MSEKTSSTIDTPEAQENDEKESKSKKEKELLEEVRRNEAYWKGKIEYLEHKRKDQKLIAGKDKKK